MYPTLSSVCRLFRGNFTPRQKKKSKIKSRIVFLSPTPRQNEAAGDVSDDGDGASPVLRGPSRLAVTGLAGVYGRVASLLRRRNVLRLTVVGAGLRRVLAIGGGRWGVHTVGCLRLGPRVDVGLTADCAHAHDLAAGGGGGGGGGFVAEADEDGVQESNDAADGGEVESPGEEGSVHGLHLVAGLAHEDHGSDETRDP